MSGITCLQVRSRPDTDGKKTTISREHSSSKSDDGSSANHTGTCRIRLPGKSELSPLKFLKHFGEKVVSILRSMSTRTRHSTKVCSSATSKPCVASIDSRRAEAIDDCIEFINASSSLPRSNSVSN